MKIVLIFLTLLLAGMPLRGADFVPHEIIFKLDGQTDPAQFLTMFQQQFHQQLSKSSTRGIQLQALFHSATQPSISIALKSIFKLQLPESSDLKAILVQLQDWPEIVYAQPNYIHRVDFFPNDPHYPKQWALASMQTEPAWEVTTGDPDVLLTVIDTGIDYLHPDLKENIFINPGEDLNGNARLDESDLNGIDDDGNGFVDDLQGWDFTDTPAYPDNGDFRERDNNPMDEHGHGTAVAGIMAAVGNNQEGIIGVAPNCRLLNLRAGTAQGLLEEDDVAAAIVYAVQMGSRVINMSFGDRVASPLLQDIVAFAFQNDCVLIASAGNSATDSTHYPSGFSETISVGAINQSEILASFSNYGSTLDLVAPGNEIFTTHLENQYQNFGGTSAAAPFVAGLAGLVLAGDPTLSNLAVKGRLINSAVDLGEFGWDAFYGSGKINAYRAVTAQFATLVEIATPEMDAGLGSDFVTIRGTVSSPLLAAYQLSYGESHNPAEFNEIIHVSQRQVVADSLGIWDIRELADGPYTLQLTLENKDGSILGDRIILNIDHTPPVISEIKLTPMLAGARPSFLIEFSTDDICRPALYFRPVNSNRTFEVLYFDYFSKNHRLNFSREILKDRVEFFLKAQNRSGLETVETNADNFFRLDLTDLPVGSGTFEANQTALLSGYLLGKASDFDADGWPEIILNEYQQNRNYGPLKIFEAAPDGFFATTVSEKIALPRDWGDVDGDGKPEILANRGPVVLIYEATAARTFPTELVWADSSDLWPSRFCDLDGDGRGELLGRRGEVYCLFESPGDNQLAFVDSFPNFTPGSNGTGVPHTEIGDFDNDGKMELLIGDADGDLFIYENNGDNSFVPTWTDRLPLPDATDYLSTGDFDGDGIQDFAAGCHSDPGLDLEHEYDSRHWLWRIYTRAGDDEFTVQWEQRFFGFFPPQDFDSGVHSGDYDNDGRDELLLILFPKAYLVEFNPIHQTFETSWYHSPAQSNTAVVLDLNGDLQPEILFGTGNGISSFHKISSAGIPTPSGLTAAILDTNRIRLSWFPEARATEYIVYRGEDPTEMVQFSRLKDTTFSDSLVQKDRTFYYAISAVDGSIESRSSPVVRVHLSERPWLVSAQVLDARRIQLNFSEAMDASAQDIDRYEINSGKMQVSSALPLGTRNAVLLSLSRVLVSAQNCSVKVTGLRDLDGMPLDETRNQVRFTFSAPPTAPYLLRAEIADRETIRLIFNEALESASAGKIENYEIEPLLEIGHITVAETSVLLQLAEGNKLGAYGQNYLIRVTGVKSVEGVPIRSGYGDQAALILVKDNLSEVAVFPNPWRAGYDPAKITFINLTRTAKIRVLNISGRLLQTLEETDGNGGLEWDLRDEAGVMLPSGIYIFHVTSGGQRKIGKFAIIR